MSANFDWQTEDDNRRAQENLWDPSPEPEGAIKTGRRPPWRLIALIATLVVMIGGIIWWRVDKHIDATMEAFRTDVIASHNLMQRAVAENDMEIFRSLLSGRLPAWTAGELDIFTANLVFDRSPFGLIPIEGSLPVIIPASGNETPEGTRVAQIELSPDLNEAIVMVDHPYRRDTTGETVILRQTAVFRRGDFRWLLAPPLDEFWGDWVTSEGDHLSLIYPRRDATIGQRLAQDLDDEIVRLCTTLEDIECSADLHLTVRLDTDPATLVSLAQPLGAIRRAREQEDILELPAPTLIGLPVDGDPQLAEEGYKALMDGYSRHIFSAIIAQAVGWRCCDDALVFNYLVEYQLSQLGMLNWPIDATDQQRVLDSRPRLSTISSYIRGRVPLQLSDERMWELNAAVDFLIRGIPGTSPARLQRDLANTSNFNQFLDRAVGSPGNDSAAFPDNLDIAWWLYAFRNAGNAMDEPPSLPNSEALYMTCTTAESEQSSGTSTLLRYAPDEERWAELYSLQGFFWASALPDPGTLLLQELPLEAESWRAKIWRDGELAPFHLLDNSRFAISYGGSDVQGQQTAIYAYTPKTGAIRSYLLDPVACGDCAATELAGLPFWSRDGQWAIYAGDNRSSPQTSFMAANERHVILRPNGDFDEMSLTLGPGDAGADSPELIPIDRGRSPFWLDDGTFGYIRRTAGGGPIALSGEEIVIATVDDHTPGIVLTSTDILDFLPEDLPARRLSLSYVVTHPDYPDRLFIVAQDAAAQRVYAISYNLNERLSEVRLELPANANHSLGFSPDGRYLVLVGQDRQATIPDNNSGVLLVQDIAENRTTPFLTRLPFFLPSVVYDWTADSRWLAVSMDDGLIGLVAPDSGYIKLLSHEYGACTSLAWLQP